jgi:hypothetical protein
LVFIRLSKTRDRSDDLEQNPDNYFAEVEQGGDLYRNMGEVEKAKLMITLRPVFPEPARKRLV